MVALAVVLLMAPAAYHRIVYAGEDSQDMHRVGSALVTAATVPLALGLAGDIYVVISKVAASPIIRLAAAGVALFSLIGLWHADPWSSRPIEPAPARPARDNTQLRRCAGCRRLKHSSRPPLTYGAEAAVATGVFSRCP